MGVDMTDSRAIRAAISNEAQSCAAFARPSPYSFARSDKSSLLIWLRLPYVSSSLLPISMALWPLTPTRRKMARSSESLNDPAPNLASFSLGR